MKISCVVLLLAGCLALDCIDALVLPQYSFLVSPLRQQRQGGVRLSPSLLHSVFENSNEESSIPSTPPPVAASHRLQRTRFAGVSVSSTGFFVILQVGPAAFLPVRVTDDVADRAAATSPEALTTLQLLANVDMAGAILPPDMLSKAVVLSCEKLVNNLSEEDANDDEDDDDDSIMMDGNRAAATKIVEQVRLQLPNATGTYGEQHPWIQARIKLPFCTLDEIVLEIIPGNNDDKASLDFIWKISVRAVEESITLRPCAQILETVMYQYRPKVSTAFSSLALALRYKAPVILRYDATAETDGHGLFLLSTTAVQERFPLFRTAAKLEQSSTRAADAVKQGFEINKLQAALRIAMQKGDSAAAAKIRKVLDERDSLQDLPVQPDSDISTMQ